MGELFNSGKGAKFSECRQYRYILWRIWDDGKPMVCFIGLNPSTAMIADAYGGDEAEEINARTGCMGCPLTDKDTALDNLLKQERYHYLAPLKRLRTVWREMRLPQNRLRKTGKEENGEKNKQRMGPLTMEARQWAFAEIMKIQDEVNANRPAGTPALYLINDEEAEFIQQCWKDNVWPNKWTGEEPTGDTVMDLVYSDGTVFPDLFGI